MKIESHVFCKDTAKWGHYALIQIRPNETCTTKWRHLHFLSCFIFNSQVYINISGCTCSCTFFMKIESHAFCKNTAKWGHYGIIHTTSKWGHTSKLLPSRDTTHSYTSPSNEDIHSNHCQVRTRRIHTLPVLIRTYIKAKCQIKTRRIHTHRLLMRTYIQTTARWGHSAFIHFRS